MEFIIDNSYIIFAILILLVMVVAVVYSFLHLPTEEQQAKVKEWLVWACIEAEKTLRTGTGQLKLRKVYDAFLTIPSFVWIAKMVSFSTFSSWVDEALATAKKMLVSNTDLATYVYGDAMTQEIAKLLSQINQTDETTGGN